MPLFGHRAKHRTQDTRKEPVNRQDGVKIVARDCFAAPGTLETGPHAAKDEEGFASPITSRNTAETPVPIAPEIDLNAARLSACNAM